MNRIEVMKRVALQAGKYITSEGADLTSTQKTGVKDFVTVADIKSQDIIRQLLHESFPGVIILSEEDDVTDQKRLYEPSFTGFVLDPIDGTYNFKRGMQESAISIGFIEDGQPLAGVVYDPFKNELFVAEMGKGAFCNNKQITVSAQTEIDGASIATSNGYDDAAALRNLKRQIAIYEQTGVMPWTSCPGSAVLTLVWTAAGRIDAMHHNSFKPWDNAAAFVILREAGATVHNLHGEDALFTDSAILVGTPGIVDQLEAIFTKIDQSLLA